MIKLLTLAFLTSFYASSTSASLSKTAPITGYPKASCSGDGVLNQLQAMFIEKYSNSDGISIDTKEIGRIIVDKAEIIGCEAHITLYYRQGDPVNLVYPYQLLNFKSTKDRDEFLRKYNKKQPRKTPVNVQP